MGERSPETGVSIIMKTGTVTYGGTINLGNYENVKLEISRSYDLSNVEEAYWVERTILDELREQFDVERRRLTCKHLPEYPEKAD